jgi:hypothetical protein
MSVLSPLSLAGIAFCVKIKSEKKPKIEGISAFSYSNFMSGRPASAASCAGRFVSSSGFL